jgi:hypothetical protein
MLDEKFPSSFESPESLQAWSEKIEREIADITSQILPLQKRLDAAREKLDLVRRIRHLMVPGVASVAGNVKAISTPLPTNTLPCIEDRIEEILRSSGKPMHIQDIRASLIQMGVPLPGRGDEANIILRLRRATDRFVRTERGTYALITWNIPEYSPAPRKKKIRKRRGATP